MKVADLLGESLDTNQLYGKLVCLVFSGIFKFREALVQIFGVCCDC